VLVRGYSDSAPGGLRLESFSFPDIEDFEVLAEPLYGCWEGNMTHAVERRPIDICRFRGEQKVVVGNAGVVRVVGVGPRVSMVKEGDVCGLASGCEWDPAGYPQRILGYDAPGSMGVLAKQMKLHESQLFVIPRDTPHSLQQWAAFTIRYVTAWDNWKIAIGAWRLQMGDARDRPVYVWGWGGGVALGELLLAKQQGCQVALICSSDERMQLCREFGIQPIDRRQFWSLNYDEQRFKSDLDYRRAYMEAETTFLNLVRDHTNGHYVSIFIDNIGEPVYRATLKALGRQGIITTTGWKEGMALPVSRGTECISRHIHVFTHGARNTRDAISYAEDHGWLPPLDGREYGWDEIPTLVEDYRTGKVTSYFPIFRINPV
jgi:NADPH:quinone reductase-like Zn-dependent oxidoreductase